MLRLTQLLSALAVSAGLAQAMFRFDCHNNLVVDRVDPIVNPGTDGTHLHVISGGNGFNKNADGAALDASTCTSCPIDADLSAYWTPTLYAKFKNGTGYGLVRSGQIVYYQPRGDKGEKIYALPKGLKVLAGDPKLRTGSDAIEQRAVTWVCLNYDNPVPEGPMIPNVKCPQGLRGQVNFPMCWNGKDLDSDDHKSHMAYAEGLEGGKCPEGYPKKVVKLFYEMFYEVGEWDSEWDGDKHPFVLSNGDPTGYSFHGDFLNGWDVDVLQDAVDNCADKNYFNPAECPALAPTYNSKPPETRCTNEREVVEEIRMVTELPGVGKMTPTDAPAPTPTPSTETPNTEEPTTKPSATPSPEPTSEPTSAAPGTVGPETPSTPETSAPAGSECSELVTDVNFIGNDVGYVDVEPSEECCTACKTVKGAKAFTRSGNRCYCKSGKGSTNLQEGARSGVFA